MNHLLDKFAFGLRCAISFILLLLLTAILMVVATLTLFKFRRLYSEYIAAPMARFTLLLWGIRLKVHGDIKPLLGQVMYISNHSSTIDIFALLALGLPNTRFFLSAYLKKFLPIGIVGSIIGNIWIVTQKRPEERVVIFKEAEQLLRRTGDSVYLSPEGKRVTTGQIGQFNKGSFHLATVLKIPIVPLFLHIPKEMDPGMGLHARAGQVDVYVGKPIDTNDWKLESLLDNKESVRDFYTNWHAELNNG